MNTFKIKKKEDFANVFRSGHFLKFNSFIIKYAKRLNTNKINMPRYGIIASKKVGNAVKRNFAKRRIRALENIFFAHANKSLDFVVVVKKRLLTENFKILSKQLEQALKNVKKNLHE